jgi:hypothetical protein
VRAATRRAGRRSDPRRPRSRRAPTAGSAAAAAGRTAAARTAPASPPARARPRASASVSARALWGSSGGRRWPSRAARRRLRAAPPRRSRPRSSRCTATSTPRPRAPAPPASGTSGRCTCQAAAWHAFPAPGELHARRTPDQRLLARRLGRLRCSRRLGVADRRDRPNSTGPASRHPPRDGQESHDREGAHGSVQARDRRPGRPRPTARPSRRPKPRPTPRQPRGELTLTPRMIAAVSTLRSHTLARDETRKPHAVARRQALHRQGRIDNQARREANRLRCAGGGRAPPPRVDGTSQGPGGDGTGAREATATLGKPRSRVSVNPRSRCAAVPRRRRPPRVAMPGPISAMGGCRRPSPPAAGWTRPRVDRG